MKSETQDPLSTFVAPLFGFKSSPPPREGRLAGLKELQKVERLTGNLQIPCAGLWAHSCHQQEWEMQVQYLQRGGNSLWDCREEVCLPLF